MKVSEIMTESVASLNSDDTIERAAQLMMEHNIGSIPVCRGEKVVGVITDRDITLRSVANGQNAKVQTVKEIMSSNPVLIQPSMETEDAARIMSERQIRRLPVVENDNLVGIISLGDIATNSTMKNLAEKTLCEISEPCTPII
ncbi:CBS domain-containing protein [Clostridium pasteurianum]|uniref:Putative signal-transduction protein containing cAMP-binding and CBS domains n=1 Tax=Clostridium pasteurianum BC1 TaxID=86416 RepID=R4K103_CLOPA|nr:CBS domain-containing protein [Clostridium pasteurianum]AGK96248.1 putative signal-transduction protein containing cAMP-binding and CBS domains [Clostridium pasteurianum BC1]